LNIDIRNLQSITVDNHLFLSRTHEGHRLSHLQYTHCVFALSAYFTGKAVCLSYRKQSRKEFVIVSTYSCKVLFLPDFNPNRNVLTIVKLLYMKFHEDQFCGSRVFHTNVTKLIAA